MLFRFTLNNEDNGALVLAQDPQGWRDLETILKRGLEYHGTFYETMVQLEFSCGSGKEYIDGIYEQYGIDAVIGIKIEISCDTSGGVSNISNDYSIDYSIDYGSHTQGSNVIQYETFYEGVLDLSKYNKTTRSTFCDIIQSDFIQKTINRFLTPVELTQNKSLDDVTLLPIAGFPSDITLHSKAIILRAEYIAYEGVTDSLFVSNPVDYVNIQIPVLVEYDDFGGASDSQTPLTFSFYQVGNPRGYDKTKPIFVNNTGEDITIELSVNIVGNLKIRNTRSFTGNFYVFLQNYDVQFAYVPFPPYLQLTTNVFVDTAPTNTIIPINASGTSTFVLPQGEKIFLCFYISDVAGDYSSPSLFEFVDFESTTFEIKIENTSITPGTPGKIFKIHEVGAAITQRITSIEDAFRSTLLGRKNSAPNSYDENGCMSFAGILSGKHIRGFDVADAPLFISMNDYFRSINSYYNIGLGFEKENDAYVIRIEEKEYFYDSSVVLIQCPFANEIKTSVAKEYYITELLVGYEDWTVENINGLDEVNSKRTYSTEISSISSKQNLESPFIGGMYAIEFIRRAGKTSIDNQYDNNNFIICLKRGVDVNGNPNQLNLAEKDENFSSVTGILEPQTSYNLRITPVRNLLRHVNTIASGIYKKVGSIIKFTYSEGNVDVVTAIDVDSCIEGNYSGELLSEKQDVQWDDVNIGVNPIWIPEYIEFEYPLSFFDYLNIKNNQYKTIEVSNGNTNFIKGFIIEIRWKPVGGIAYFKLLRVWQ